MTEKVIHIGDPETKEVIPVTFVNIDDATIKEAANYYGYVKEKVSTPIKAIKVTLCDDGMVDVSYDCEGAKFERIRRITGLG